MPASLSTISALTKELYEGSLRKQLYQDTIAIKRIERSSEGVTSEVGGKYVTFPIHTRRNTGIGARNENELLPLPGQQGTAAARIGLKYQYGAVQLTGQTLELAKSNAQAFVSALDLEINGLKDDLRRDTNRQFYGDGTGALAVAKTAGTTVNTFTAQSTGRIQDGMAVDVFSAAAVASNGAATASNRIVTNYVDSTGVITLSGAPFTTAVGDVLVRTGSVNREWTGIGAMIKDTGTLYNIDPAVERVWKSEVLANGGTNRALSEGLMIEAADRVYKNGGNTTLILQSMEVRRAYFNLLSQQRSVVNTQKFEGGFTGLAFTTDRGEIPVIADPDCPPNTQYFINEKEIKIYREGDWSFMDRDGSMWQRVIGYDAYQATMYQYSELGTHRRNSHAVIRDIIEG